MAAKLIFWRAVYRNPTTSELQSYWPERWPLELLAKEYCTSTPSFFNASYQNDAKAAAGSLLKRDWLQYYLPDELQAARAQYGVRDHGAMHAGADLAGGGDSRTSDFMAVAALEKIANKAFLTHFHMGRYSLDVQAQKLEDQLDIIQPMFTVIEDISAKGYVYTALDSQINDGKGSTHAFTIEKPQSKAAGGDKENRFKAMAARFSSGQIKLPGRQLPGGEVIAAAWVQRLVDQWTSFPSGHDDGLDALYWAVYSAFGTDAVVSASKRADGSVESHSAYTDRSRIVSDDAKCNTRGHIGYNGLKIACISCQINSRLNAREQLTTPRKGTTVRSIAAKRPHFSLRRR